MEVGSTSVVNVLPTSSNDVVFTPHIDVETTLEIVVYEDCIDVGCRRCFDVIYRFGGLQRTEGAPGDTTPKC